MTQQQKSLSEKALRVSNLSDSFSNDEEVDFVPDGVDVKAKDALSLHLHDGTRRIIVKYARV